MKEGASDVLTKPIDFRRLKHELERILDGMEHPCDDSSLSGSNPALSKSASQRLPPSKEARFAPAK
jgi:FixJ family two-component response regulator